MSSLKILCRCWKYPKTITPEALWRHFEAQAFDVSAGGHVHFGRRSLCLPWALRANESGIDGNRTGCAHLSMSHPSSLNTCTTTTRAGRHVPLHRKYAQGRKMQQTLGDRGISGVTTVKFMHITLSYALLHMCVCFPRVGSCVIYIFILHSWPDILFIKFFLKSQMVPRA